MSSRPPDDPPLDPRDIAASKIGPEDVEFARVAWREDAPPGFEDLLDAQEETRDDEA